jgi:hypothetical protein
MADSAGLYADAHFAGTGFGKLFLHQLKLAAGCDHLKSTT